MSGKQYLNAFMNNTATIRDVLAADVQDAPHKVLAYNAEGKLALPAADGDPAIGIILSDAPTNDSGITPPARRSMCLSGISGWRRPGRRWRRVTS